MYIYMYIYIYIYVFFFFNLSLVLKRSLIFSFRPVELGNFHVERVIIFLSNDYIYIF